MRALSLGSPQIMQFRLSPGHSNQGEAGYSRLEPEAHGSWSEPQSPTKISLEGNPIIEKGTTYAQERLSGFPGCLPSESGALLAHKESMGDSGKQFSQLRRSYSAPPLSSAWAASASPGSSTPAVSSRLRGKDFPGRTPKPFSISTWRTRFPRPSLSFFIALP